MPKDESEVLAELRSIKMLFVLGLLRQGLTQGQIAQVLGVSDATMSRMLPKGIGKSVQRKNGSVDAERGE